MIYDIRDEIQPVQNTEDLRSVAAASWYAIALVGGRALEAYGFPDSNHLQIITSSLIGYCSQASIAALAYLQQFHSSTFTDLHILTASLRTSTEKLHFDTHTYGIAKGKSHYYGFSPANFKTPAGCLATQIIVAESEHDLFREFSDIVGGDWKQQSIRRSLQEIQGAMKDYTLYQTPLCYDFIKEILTKNAPR